MVIAYLSIVFHPEADHGLKTHFVRRSMSVVNSIEFGYLAAQRQNGRPSAH